MAGVPSGETSAPATGGGIGGESRRYESKKEDSSVNSTADDLLDARARRRTDRVWGSTHILSPILAAATRTRASVRMAIPSVRVASMVAVEAQRRGSVEIRRGKERKGEERKR